MKKYCRTALLLLAVMVSIPAANIFLARARAGPVRRDHLASKTSKKKPKTRRTKKILKGRHGKHARKPA